MIESSGKTTPQVLKKEELENLYLKQKLPIYKIAKKSNFSHNFKIYELMNEFNIKTRNHSEALKGRPMIKKRSKLSSKILNSIEAVTLFKSLDLSSLKTSEEKANFVKGFADAESSVTIFNNWDNKRLKYKRNYKIAIYNSDKDLIERVQSILSSLDIKSFLYKIFPKNNFGKKLKYELVISHKSLDRFAEIVGFNYPEKFEKLNKIIGGE